MTRRCPIIDCDNTEDQTPGHRFPQNKEQVQSWKDSLKLKEFPIELLQTKFYVCKNHFSKCDYANDNHLLSTAVPKLDSVNDPEREVNSEGEIMRKVETTNETCSANATDSESIEIVAPTECVSSACMMRLALSGNNKGACTGIEDSAYSQDISILEAHDSHYDMEEPCAGNLQESCALLDAPDFTVLNADEEWKYSVIKRHRNCTSCNTAVFLHRNTNRPTTNATSGTDSDVEILMSEEVMYSDWSAENNEDLLTLSTSSSVDVRENVSADVAVGNIILGCSEQEKTEENLSPETMDAFELMSHMQLVKVIKSQAAKIRALENTLKRYHDAQSSLFTHVDALRAEFENDLLIHGHSYVGKGASHTEAINKKKI